MSGVVINIKKSGDARYSVIEVSLEVEAEKLASMIASALNCNRDNRGNTLEFQLKLEASGRVISSYENLGNAKVMKGSALVLEPTGRVDTVSNAPGRSAPQAAPQSGAPSSPVSKWRSLGLDFGNPTSTPVPANNPAPVSSDAPASGWRPLGIPNSGGDTVDQNAEPKPSPFVWKKLD